MEELGTEISPVVFHLGEELYALRTQEAREVVTYQRPRPLPGADRWVQGVINLRGEIVPVCDLPAALGLGQRCRNGRIVICDSERGSVGFSVDDVRAVMAVQESLIEPIPSLEHPAMSGLIQSGDELIVVLRIAPIVAGSAQDVGAVIADGALVPDTPQDISHHQEVTTEDDGRLAA